MARENSVRWRLDRRINLSVVVQLLLLASLILGSWINLQTQLDLLQRDVAMLLEGQKQFKQKIELLWSKSISHEYRLRALEKDFAEADFEEEIF